MVFVDASAMIAMLVREPDAVELAEKLEGQDARLCSAVALWETVAGLCRVHTLSVGSARTRVKALQELLDIQLVPIGVREYELAVQAYRDFGKGRHPAALNMGDCFAYACARANQAALLFTGGDFSKTDIQPA